VHAAFSSRIVTAKISQYLTAAVFLVWAITLSYFYYSGRAASYLHPFFIPNLAVAGFVLFILAAIAAFAPAPPTRQRRGGSLAGNVASCLFLTIPLLAATSISPSQFGATAVLNRGFIEDIGDLPAYSPPMDPPLPNADGTIGEGTMMNPSLYLAKNENGEIKAETVDLLYAASEEVMREDFEGQTVEVIGQFLPTRTDTSDGNRFRMVRMFVVCCAADARPVAILVEAQDVASFPEMSWVKVRGVATFPLEGDRRIPLLIATSIAPTEAPVQTFLY